MADAGKTEGADGALRAGADKTQAIAAKVAAAVGGIAIVYARSPALSHHSLADLEWLILPAVLHGQFHIVEAAIDLNGRRGPIAAATWAFVSPDVDARLTSEFSHNIRLRPEEWKCGDIGWIVDWAGDPNGVSAAIAWLKAGPFKDKNAKIAVRDLAGGARIATLDDVAEASAERPRSRRTGLSPKPTS
jgi:hemolysin-activating ACP:hemolysin acyltransferase